MLQYALLHLFGYKVSLDDIKAFRVSHFDSPRSGTFVNMAIPTRPLRV